MRGFADRSHVGRGMLAAAVIAAVATVAGCNASSGQPSGKSREAAKTVAVLPAFEAGGACQLLDYDTIRRTVGLDFAVAAAAQQGETYTCLVQQRGVSYPDLALSVSATVSDEKAFQSAIIPQGAGRIDGLGKIAYGVAIAATNDAGPGVQVGWLSANRRLLVLRVRFAPGATKEMAAGTTSKLVALAQVVDFISA